MLYKALIRSVMTYASPTWAYVADAHLMKLQRLENKVFRTIGNLDRCTPVRGFHVVFKLPYVTKSCKTQAEVIMNDVDPNIRGIGQGEARRRKYKRLRLGGAQTYDRSAD
jgi:hypothetical protein